MNGIIPPEYKNKFEHRNEELNHPELIHEDIVYLSEFIPTPATIKVWDGVNAYNVQY